MHMLQIGTVYFTSPKDDVCNYILDMLHTFLTLFAYVNHYILLISNIILYTKYCTRIYRDMLGLHGGVMKTIDGSVYAEACWVALGQY